MSLLLKLMGPSIVEGFLFLDYTKEIWDLQAEIYDEQEILARIYQLQSNMTMTFKGDKAFHTYLNSQKSIFNEL